ncbi:chaperone modulator CbpM [Herminiimonas glaciei]|uniref:Chaperone modulator CbpM n=1 Tax=Herminiimonas glaciei TaxID=523788 RepID=A0ABW2I891_9BURK
MNQTTSVYCESQLLDDDVTLTLIELSQACNAPQDLITAWVFEGVLEADGQQPQEWRFSGAAVRRARVAQHLAQDLEVNTPGVALALDLLERIDALEAQLKRRSRY